MHNQGLGSWLAKRRLKSPDKTALIFADDQRVTYRELADLADGLSALLWSRGIRKGDAVAYLGENSPEFLATLFGCAQLGAVFVPVNTRLAPPEILHVLADSRCSDAHSRSGVRRAARSFISAAGIAHVVETGEEHPTALRDWPDPCGLADLGTPTPTSPSKTPRRSSTPRARRVGRRVRC